MSSAGSNDVIRVMACSSEVGAEPVWLIGSVDASSARHGSPRQPRTCALCHRDVNSLCLAALALLSLISHWRCAGDPWLERLADAKIGKGAILVFLKKSGQRFSPQVAIRMFPGTSGYSGSRRGIIKCDWIEPRECLHGVTKLRDGNSGGVQFGVLSGPQMVAAAPSTGRRRRDMALGYGGLAYWPVQGWRTVA